MNDDRRERESKVDINELLSKYLSDTEGTEAPSAPSDAEPVRPARPRRRMPARRMPDSVGEESAEAPAEGKIPVGDADGAASLHDGSVGDASAAAVSGDGAVDSGDGAVDSGDGAAVSDNGAVDSGDGAAVSDNGAVDSGDGAAVSDNGAVDSDDGAAADGGVSDEITADGVVGDGDVSGTYDEYSYNESAVPAEGAASGEADAGVFARYESDGGAESYDDVDGGELGDDDITVDEDGEPIDDFDMNILLGLGMEEELEQTVGTDRVSKFVEKQQSTLHKSVSVSRERAALDYEYTTKSQTREVSEMYAGAHRAARLRLLAAAVLSVALLVFESHGTFGLKLGGAFDPVTYPVVYIMVGLQLVLLAAAFAFKSVWSGLCDFFRGKPTPECVAGFALIFDIIYSAAISFCGPFGEGGPATFHLPVAVGFLLLYIYDLVNIRRERYSFGVISSRKKKYALASLSMADSHLEHEAFSDLMEEGDRAEEISVLKMEGADFVGDYFLRTNRYPGGRKFIGFIIPAVIVMAAAFFAYSYRGSETAYDGIRAAGAVALTCLPMSVFYMFSHPFFRAVKKAREEECTIVGEGSLEEYADAAIISFDDKNVFPSTGVNVRGINVFGNHMIDRVLYTAASVFCTIGGPLSDVFDLATRDIGHSDDVTVNLSLPGLLSVTVNGSDVMFGSLDALEEAGVRIPRPLAERRGDDFGDTVSVMYMVEGGRFIARMLIQYLVDADFEYTLKQLDRSGMCVGIKTFDPNVTEEFLSKQVGLKHYPVRIIRCKSMDDRTADAEVTASGLISRDSPKSLLQMVALCERVLHARSINTMLVVISLFVSLVVAALSVLFGAITLSPIFISLYQLVWIVPMFIASKLIIS